MPRKGQLLKTRKRAAVKPAGPPHNQIDPLAGKLLVRYMEEHFEWMTVTGYSADTVRARRQHIRKFISWIDERGIDSPTQIIRPMVERYQRHLRTVAHVRDVTRKTEVPLAFGERYQQYAAEREFQRAREVDDNGEEEELQTPAPSRRRRQADQDDVILDAALQVLAELTDLQQGVAIDPAHDKNTLDAQEWLRRIFQP